MNELVLDANTAAGGSQRRVRKLHMNHCIGPGEAGKARSIAIPGRYFCDQSTPAVTEKVLTCRVLLFHVGVTGNPALALDDRARRPDARPIDLGVTVALQFDDALELHGA